VSQLADSVDFFDEVNEYEDLEFVDWLLIHHSPQFNDYHHYYH
jgi:hypothetical protein